MFRKPPKIDRLRHRSWEDVALMYSARTGEAMSEHKARDTGLRAIKKIVKELRKPANYRLREALAAEGIVV